MTRRLATLLALCLLASLAHAAEKEAPSVGVVTARAGSCVVVALNEGAAAKVGDVFETHRARLLVTLARQGKRFDASANWEKSGKIAIRVLKGKRFAIGLVVEESERKGPTGQPVPSILPGDALRPAKP